MQGIMREDRGKIWKSKTNIKVVILHKIKKKSLNNRTESTTTYLKKKMTWSWIDIEINQCI